MDKTSETEAPQLYDETVFHNPAIIAGERVLLHAERPQISKRNVEGRRAVITRRAVTVRKSIDVDVVHEELQIDYLPGSSLEMIGEQAESVIVRLHAEEIEIVKHVRVVEEILLSKRRVIEMLPVSIDLQHEELKIIDTPT